jgi:hypothetical protein
MTAKQVNKLSVDKLKNLVSAQAAYIDYLTEASSMECPHLNHNFNYPDGFIDKGVVLRNCIASIIHKNKQPN